METTTSPLRRHLVWSHNTTYAGAAGVHSEVSKKAHAIQATGQRQLTSNLSTIHSIHQKELRSLKHHRRSLETSMLAYTEKMKKISSERLLLAVPSLPPGDDQSAYSSAERTLDSTGKDVHRLDGLERNSRVSVDSGIDVTETRSEVGGIKGNTNGRHLLAVTTSSTDSLPKSRPASFHSLAYQDAVSEQTVPEPSSVSNSGKPARQRRPGTAEKPDIFALKLSMERQGSPKIAITADENKGPSSLEEQLDPSLAITPFPDYKAPSANVRVNAAGVLISPPEDRERAHGTSSRTSQSSTKKLSKSKENYWSYRRSPRYSLPIIKPQTFPQQPREETATVPAAPVIAKRRRKPPKRSNKTYHRSFRYSDAVDDVIRSFEESASNLIKKSALRRASEILPAIDFQDLRLQKLKLKHETEKLETVAERVYASSPDEHTSEDGWSEDHHDSDDEADRDDTVCDELSLPFSRERSLSAPELFGAQEEQTLCEKEEEEEEEEEEYEHEPNERRASVLRKTVSDSDCLRDMPPRRVHFRLPELCQ